MGLCLGKWLPMPQAHPSTHGTSGGNLIKKTGGPIHRIGDFANPQKFLIAPCKNNYNFGRGGDIFQPSMPRLSSTL